MFFYLLLFSLWLLREIKLVLFWVYFWQLKEYHIGRLIDHFRTFKGKRLFLNFLIVIKVILLFGLFLDFGESYYSSVFLFLLLIYLLESLKLFHGLIFGGIKRPILTIKTLFLSFVSFFGVLFYGVFAFYNASFLKRLLLFDILTPLVVSLIVLLFQPLTVFLRNKKIKKAQEKRRKFKDLLVIGITGSYGKTSTKEFLYEILSRKFNVLKTRGHQNSEIGIAQCILKNLNKDHDIFIAEMGAYNKGGIKKLTNIAQPQFGILTGINEQHLATFGSIENTIKAKYEIVNSLPKGGTAILNGNNEIIWGKRKETQKNNSHLREILYCSTQNKEADFYADSIIEEKDRIGFKINHSKSQIAFEFNLIGKQNIENLLLAICCAKKIGMSFNEIVDACKKIQNIVGAIKKDRGIKNSFILDSTYSSNPSGVIAHLDYLKKWEGKKIIIMPCLIELAQSSSQNHRRIGEKIGEVCDLAIITTKDKFQDIKKGADKKGMRNVIFSENPQDIIERLKLYIKEGDVILLEGRINEKIKELLLKK